MKKSDYPYALHFISEKDVEEVSKVLRSKIITRGSKVEAFEEAIASYTGANFGVAFSSGSAALMAAYHVVELASSDRVLTTPNTFVATLGSVEMKGATPVWIDIEEATGNLDLKQLKENLQYRSTRGRTIIVPVHFAGIAVDMATISKMSKDPNTIVIEDAAHALGSSYLGGKKVGCCDFSDLAILSFHASKNITTGEGGMVLTNDQDLYHRLKRFRNNGIERDYHFFKGESSPWIYEVQEISSNYHLTDFQAALGLSQLKRLDSFVEKRRKLVQLYREKLKDFPHIKLFPSEVDLNTAFHLFVVQIDFSALKVGRQEVMQSLEQKGIKTQVHYIPIYRHPYFIEKYGDLSSYFPRMERYYSRALTLPLYPQLEEEDIEKIVLALKEALNLDSSHD